jgi:CheY-like chemotaxis protein
MSAKKILLVDGDSDVRTVVRDALEESGYQIWQASDGSEALNIWKSDTPSVAAQSRQFFIRHSATGIRN